LKQKDANVYLPLKLFKLSVKRVSGHFFQESVIERKDFDSHFLSLWCL